MKMMIFKIKNFINFNLIFLGFLILFWFFWNKFIKKKLPSDIPFILTEYRFFVLFFLCLSYLLIIYIIIKKNNNTKNNSFLKKLLKLFFLPFENLDRFIKNKINTKYINFLFKINKLKKKQDINALDYLLPAPLKNIYNKKTYPKAKFFYIFFNLIPRIILISLLILDIFIFNRVEYFYTFVLLSLFPLCHRYIKYSLQNIEKDIIYYLQLRFDSVELEDNAINKDYIFYLLNAKDNPDKYPGNKYHEKMCTMDESIKTINYYPSLTKEVKVIDTLFKAICADLETLTTSFNVHVEKSTELASEWNNNILKVNAAVKEMKASDWKKKTMYFMLFSTFVYGVYQMGLYRKIPDFFSILACNIPLPSLPGMTPKVPEITPISLENTISKVLETPVTPIAIVTGVGTIVTGIVCLRLITKIIRFIK